MALAGSKMVLGKGHSRATLLKSRGMAYKPNSLPSDKGIRASLKDASDNTLTAVVVGGGMSGLSAAQSLSRTFGRVILLERDTPASNWKPEQEYAIQDPHIRRGVPQYRFLHAYLTKGIQVLEALFPGFLEELHRNGAETVEFRKGFCQISPTYGEAPLAGHWENDLREPLSLTTTTRHTVEQTTRHLLSLNSAVEMRYGTVVKELLQEKSPVTGQGAVVGVCLTSGEEIRGDLVVDASGKNSGIAKALLDGKVEGMMKVETEQVDAKTIYYMRHVKLSPTSREKLGSFKSFYLMAEPSWPYLSILQYSNRETFIAAFGTVNQPRIRFSPPGPEQDQEFLKHMEQYGHPKIKALVQDATYLSPVLEYVNAPAFWHHFELLPQDSRFPDGLVLLGDAVCGFNPVYGQGVTVAAIQAHRLGEMLQDRLQQYSGDPQAQRTLLNGFPMEWQQEAAKLVNPCWQLAKDIDLQFPGTVVSPPLPSPRGFQSLMQKALGAYNSELQYLTYHDPLVQGAFDRVWCMVAPLELLVSPPVARRVLGSMLTRKWDQWLNALKGQGGPVKGTGHSLELAEPAPLTPQPAAKQSGL